MEQFAHDNDFFPTQARIFLGCFQTFESLFSRWKIGWLDTIKSTSIS